MSKRNTKSIRDFKKVWHDNPKFKTLAKKWSKKLADSGFEDIEEFDSPLELLKSNHNFRFIDASKTGRLTDDQRYYELARQLLHDYPFESKEDYKIWEQHAEGVSERKIGKIVGATDHKVRMTIKFVKQAIKRDAKDIIVDLKTIRSKK